MRICVFFICLSWLIACSDAESTAPAAENSSTAASEQLTTIEWIEPNKNLGKITEGQVLSIHFKFKNTGENPLVIKSVQPSCGCTVADFPKQPIPPGGEGEITGSFDSNGRLDHQSKDILVVANTKGSPNHTLHFELNVVKGAEK
jgi:hypothetical protein